MTTIKQPVDTSTIDNRIDHYIKLYERATEELRKVKRGSFKYYEISKWAHTYRNKIEQLRIEKEIN
ncbi:MAG: hypothetical protein ACRDDZ_05915 [Marinifilaceae bacterium]